MTRLFCALTCILMLCRIAGAQTVVKIDPAKTIAANDKQFAQHLNDTLFLGNRVQMVKDRAFARPINDEYAPQTANGSPWKVIGASGLVAMDKEHPFVGEHAVALTIPGSGAETGISQPGMSVVKGKKYVGNIVLAGEGEVTPVIVQLSLQGGQVVTQSIDKITAEYKSYPLEFVSPASANDATLEIISTATGGVLRMGAVSLMAESVLNNANEPSGPVGDNAFADSVGGMKGFLTHFGDIAIEVPQKQEKLDIAAAWTQDRSAITIAIVNRSTSAQGISLEIANFTFKAEARMLDLSSTTSKETNVTIKNNILTALPLSAVVYRLEKR